MSTAERLARKLRRSQSWWTWATVTEVGPLKVQLDGRTSAMATTPEDHVGGLAVNDRVRMHFHYGRAYVASKPGGQMIRPNLAINPTFRINQRGYVSGASLAINTYGFDHWKSWAGGSTSGTFTAAPGGQTVTVTGYWIQMVERQNVRPGTYTLSWGGTATADVVNSGDPISLTAGGSVTRTLTAAADLLLIIGGGTIEWVKLEAGSIATPFVLPGYAEDLAACQRYHYRLECGATSSPVASLAVLGSTVAIAVVHFPTSMRATPTFTSSTASGFAARSGGATATLTALSQDAANTTTSSLLVTVASGLTSGQSGYLRAASASGQYLAFDAEL